MNQLRRFVEAAYVAIQLFAIPLVFLAIYQCYRGAAAPWTLGVFCAIGGMALGTIVQGLTTRRFSRDLERLKACRRRIAPLKQKADEALRKFAHDASQGRSEDLKKHVDEYARLGSLIEALYDEYVEDGR